LIIKHFRFSHLTILAVLFFISAQQVFAQGGGHEPIAKKAGEAAVMDSMYSAKQDEAGLLSDSDKGFDNMFSPMDLFTESELVSPIPMENMKMNESHSEHSGHQGTQIKIAEHERVTSSSKGFGVGVGITLFAGMVFAGLTIMRPGEK
jgi:hypothetical protein